MSDSIPNEGRFNQDGLPPQPLAIHQPNTIQVPHPDKTTHLDAGPAYISVPGLFIPLTILATVSQQTRQFTQAQAAAQAQALAQEFALATPGNTACIGPYSTVEIPVDSGGDTTQSEPSLEQTQKPRHEELKSKCEVPKSTRNKFPETIPEDSAENSGVNPQESQVPVSEPNSAQTLQELEAQIRRELISSSVSNSLGLDGTPVKLSAEVKNILLNHAASCRRYAQAHRHDYPPTYSVDPPNLPTCNPDEPSYGTMEHIMDIEQMFTCMKYNITFVPDPRNPDPLATLLLK